MAGKQDFKLTIRIGSRVEREQYPTLEGAIEALRGRVARLRSEGDLPSISMLREFSPEQRVRARLEISTGKIFRRREAGVDVMGDGSLVPYLGGATKTHLDPEDEAAFADALAAALRE